MGIYVAVERKNIQTCSSALGCFLCNTCNMATRGGITFPTNLCWWQPWTDKWNLISWNQMWTWNLELFIVCEHFVFLCRLNSHMILYILNQWALWTEPGCVLLLSVYAKLTGCQGWYWSSYSRMLSLNHFKSSHPLQSLPTTLSCPSDDINLQSCNYF